MSSFMYMWYALSPLMRCFAQQAVALWIYKNGSNNLEFNFVKNLTLSKTLLYSATNGHT